MSEIRLNINNIVGNERAIHIMSSFCQIMEIPVNQNPEFIQKTGLILGGAAGLTLGPVFWINSDSIKTRKGKSTSVKRTLQIHSIMQNEPNFFIGQINAFSRIWSFE